MEKKFLNKKQLNKNNFNQRTYNPATRVNQENNKNKIAYQENINKDSYKYLHSKKVNNISNKNSNFQSLMDFSEPEPQVFQGFNQINNKNNSFDLISNKRKYISNNNKTQNSIDNNQQSNNISKRNNNKKLLEEYFQLKNKNNYNTLNILNNNKQIEEQYIPLMKKNKTKKKKSQIKDIKIKKSNSLKGDLLQIYQPENNMKNSPSFTPVKNKLKNKKKLNKNEKTPNFNSNSKSNICITNNKTPKNSSTQRYKFDYKYLNFEEMNLNSRKIINNKENKKYRMGHRTPTSTRKNLTPSKIPGIWIDSNNINYNKTFSIVKNDNNINKNIYSASYIQSNNNTPSINSTELYWKRKEKEKEKKLEQIRTERILKEEKELQDRPKINQNSKRILSRREGKNVDVFDRLSDLNQIKNHNMQMEKIKETFQESHIPLINNNSRRMKRTIEDLYNWKNMNERKKTESANNFNKIMKAKQIKIDPFSEELLRERKAEYLNKKVEDRLLEQGRIQKYKNEIERQKYINKITTGQKYINNEYINVQSRYLESANSNNINFNHKNYKSCDRLIKKDNKNNYKTLSSNTYFNILKLGIYLFLIYYY